VQEMDLIEEDEKATRRSASAPLTAINAYSKYMQESVDHYLQDQLCKSVCWQLHHRTKQLRSTEFDYG